MQRQSIATFSEFSQKGEEIYQKKIKKITKKQTGKIVAIEVESGDYFIADTVLQAGMAGRKKYPDKQFYFVRVGYPAVHSIKGVVKKRVK